MANFWNATTKRHDWFKLHLVGAEKRLMRTDAPPLAGGVAPTVASTVHADPLEGSATGARDGGGDPSDHDDPRPSAAWRFAIAAGAILLLGAVVVLLYNAASTSSARVTASTSGEGVLVAGDVVLEKVDSTAELFLDADDLYPGLEVRGCAVIEYSGSVPATIRLHGDPGAGTGLDAFVDIRLVRLPGGECPAPDESDRAPGREVFDGRLAALWTDHSSWADGLTVDASLAPGDRLVIEAIASVVDDDGAQGLTTGFSLTVEGRPA